MAAKRKVVDRERMELDYRTGILTFREMAAAHGLSAPRIKQIADEEGWGRDLSKRIKQAAEAKLNAARLNANLNAEAKKATEREIIESSSGEVATVLLSHRTDIGRARGLANKLLTELECQNADHKTLAMRVSTMKALAETLKTLISLERTAFNLDSTDEADADAAKQFIETMLHGRARAAAR
jgi:hypothetical protein